MTRTTTRTWQQNSDAINGLWPHCQWTDEEIDLWRSDLSLLDQDVLFEAIREVKRSRDTLYPQLAWVHAAYRPLAAARRAAEKASAAREPVCVGEKLEIDANESRRLAAEIGAEIEAAAPADVDAILAKIEANVDRMDAVTAARLAWRAGRRRQIAGPEPIARPGDDRAFADAIDVESGEDTERRRAEQLRLLRESA
ncbi:MAG: hypothetical protein RLZZ21_1371 [Planctomycetota bacterium]|jgi:hypothetical protein